MFKKKVLFFKLLSMKHIKNGYKFGHAHVKCLMCRYGGKLGFKYEPCKKSNTTLQNVRCDGTLNVDAENVLKS